MKKVAVLLSGCGFLDGAEIREAVLTLLALDTAKADYSMFALNEEQHHVVDHLAGAPVEESRNILVESARIARGDIKDLTALNVEEFDALVMPGGFGVAKNMCSFAFEGAQASVNPQVLEVLNGFYAAKKPIGAICISPALVALALGKQSPTLTIGTDTGTASEIEKLGATHQTCATDMCVVDEVHKIVTTPAYMDDAANLADIFAGISKLVDQVLKMA